MIEPAQPPTLQQRRDTPLLRWLIAFVIVPVLVWGGANWGFSSASYGSARFIVFGMFCMILMPRIMLRLALPCQDLDEIRARELQRRINPLRRSDARFMVWQTGGKVCNATIQCGLIGRPRILFSDLMLKHFNNDELAAVARHELSHWRGGHAALRFGALIAPLLILITFDLMGDWHLLVTIRENGMQFRMTVVGFFVLCIALLLNILLFQVTAYYCEFDADRGAIEMPGTNLVCQKKAVALLRVFQKMAGLAPRTRFRGSLAHPSIQARMGRVQARLVQFQESAMVPSLEMESV